MAFRFSLNRESLKRRFAVYVVVATSNVDIKLYVGKVGDNYVGCNPMISRCGNHFSHYKVHSQIRNHVSDYDDREFVFVFDHFGDYPEDRDAQREGVKRINEMERWLNEEIQKAIAGIENVQLLNPLKGSSAQSRIIREERTKFRDTGAKEKIVNLVAIVLKELGSA